MDWSKSCKKEEIKQWRMHLRCRQLKMTTFKSKFLFLFFIIFIIGCSSGIKDNSIIENEEEAYEWLISQKGELPIIFGKEGYWVEEFNAWVFLTQQQTTCPASYRVYENGTIDFIEDYSPCQE